MLASQLQGTVLLSTRNSDVNIDLVQVTCPVELGTALMEEDDGPYAVCPRGCIFFLSFSSLLISRHLQREGVCSWEQSMWRRLRYTRINVGSMWEPCMDRRECGVGMEVLRLPESKAN